MKVTATELGHLLNGIVDGNGDVTVDRPARIEDGEPGSLTFLANPKYESFIYQTNASVVLVAQDFQPRKEVKATLIRVENVYESMALLLEQFAPKQPHTFGVSKFASVADDVVLPANVSIGDFVVIESGATIGKNSIIAPFTYLGHNVNVGNDVHLHTGVKVYHDCVISDRVKIHANTVIGSDGFGFVRTNGQYRKINQVGNVIIEPDVEIGANVVIDRASIGSTIVRRGAKLDNLIQIAHNVEIGPDTVMAAQSGVAGSTKIGANSMIGGQAGIVGHINIGPRTQIQAQSGVTTSTQAGERLYGSPALDYVGYLKSYALFRKLPELMSEVNRLEQRVAELENKLKDTIEPS